MILGMTALFHAFDAMVCGVVPDTCIVAIHPRFTAIELAIKSFVEFEIAR